MKASDYRYKVRSRTRPYLLTGVSVFVSVVFAIAIMILLIGPIADVVGGQVVRDIPDLKDKAAAINANRQMLLSSAAGLVAAVALAFTARTYYLNRRGQITDRFGKAISQLASEALSERLGGIYALEYVMRESPKEHENVVSTLSAFIRDTAPRLLTDEDIQAQDVVYPRRNTHSLIPHPKADVQAALTVLARRPLRAEALRLNLSDSDLRGAHIPGARFASCYFSRSDLRGSYIRGAHLRAAVFAGTHLEGVNLIEADLRLSDMSASLTGANLAKSDIRGADLRKSIGLDQKSLKGAKRDKDTQLPDHRAASNQSNSPSH